MENSDIQSLEGNFLNNNVKKVVFQILILNYIIINLHIFHGYSLRELPHDPENDLPFCCCCYLVYCSQNLDSISPELELLNQ